MDFAGMQVDQGASFIHNSIFENPLGVLAHDLDWPTANGTFNG